jgi:hypothetical protein
LTTTKSMVTPSAVKVAAAQRYARDFAIWAASSDPIATLSVSLHPPTETMVLSNSNAAIEWAHSWRKRRSDASVEWERRRWANVGVQDVPSRCTLDGMDAIAEWAGKSAEWSHLFARCSNLRARWETTTSEEDSLGDAMRREARTLTQLEVEDFERFRSAVDWLVAHPEPGWYVRQLPIRGLDTKWLEGHRRLVATFVKALSGRLTLDLAKPSELVRVKFLDPAMRPGGLKEVAAPTEQLALLSFQPEVVFVFENLESLAAMPDMPGAVGVHGSGYAVKRVGDIPWIRSGRVGYWGDLDSNGLAILNLIRSKCLDVTSLLMDDTTLFAHQDLWVTETSPNRGSFDNLNDDEQRTLGYLRDHGNVRLEQERVPWDTALSELRNFRNKTASSA